MKLRNTKFKPFDDYFHHLTWACGVGDIALKFAPLERPAQILLTATKKFLGTHLLFLLFHHGVSPQSIHCTVKLNNEFLSAEAETWDSRDGYKAAKEKVVAPHFANDCAQCAIKLATDFNLALRHDKEQHQLTFKVLENHGQNMALKKTFQIMNELSN